MSNKQQEADLQAAIKEQREAIDREMTEVNDRVTDLEQKLAAAPDAIDLSDEIAAIRASTAAVSSMVQSAAPAEPGAGGGEAAPVEETAPGAGETAPVEEPAPGEEQSPAEGETGQ